MLIKYILETFFEFNYFHIYIY